MSNSLATSGSWLRMSLLRFYFCHRFPTLYLNFNLLLHYIIPNFYGFVGNIR